MNDNYAKIIKDNLEKLFHDSIEERAENIPATIKNSVMEFNAFGKKCKINKNGIGLEGIVQHGAPGIIISLYALNVNNNQSILEPLKAFKDFPNSMPYAGAFDTHTQNILVPYIEKIEQKMSEIIEHFEGSNAESAAGADFSFFVKPLPKIFLCYIFYRADDDFQASVTCLYSSNALSFIPIDALADVGEYTSKAIIDLIK